MAGVPQIACKKNFMARTKIKLWFEQFFTLLKELNLHLPTCKCINNLLDKHGYALPQLRAYEINREIKKCKIIIKTSIEKLSF